MENRIKIGISACLLGENVRWNGGHSRDRYLTDTLGLYVEYVAVCPEVECGMGVPRETLRLVGDPDNPSLVTSKTNIDHTDRMNRWARKRIKDLEKEDLCGFVFKKKSPSSGLFNVPVRTSKGIPQKKGQGIFARIFTEHFPLIPVEEEGRLNDPKLRETFIEQIFTLKRWRETLAKRKSIGTLVEFHTQHKLLMMSHSPNHSRLMGKLVAGGKAVPAKDLFEQYEILLMEVGWPSEGSGSEKEQRQFIRALPSLLDGVNVSVLAWALLHDVRLEEFDANLNSVGLLTAEGRRKPAFDAFEKLHASTRR